MAVDSGYKRPRKRRKQKKPKGKLLVGEQVEVLYSDEGLKGSWHMGTVINCGKCTRLIEYSNLLSDDNLSKLKELIHVSPTLEGLTEKLHKDYRGHIRPLPPHYKFQKSEIKYGVCVDALVDDAWWEGVVFDREENSNERLIFFPDQGDQQIVAVDRLRLTQEWNEISGHWKLRGDWIMLKVLECFEQQEELPVSVREIWFDLRTTDSFLDNIGMWAFGSRDIWHDLIAELIQELRCVVHGAILPIPMKEFPCSLLYTHEDHSLPNEIVPTVALENMHTNGSESSIIESWKPLELEAVYYPEAVKICASEDGRNQAREVIGIEDHWHSVRLKAKKHLLALGWKIETKRTEKLSRVRFKSPEGRFYYSVHKACYRLLHGHRKRKLKCRNLKNADIGCSSSNISEQAYFLQEHQLKRSNFLSINAKSNKTHTEKNQSWKMVRPGITDELSPGVVDQCHKICDENELGNYPEAVLEYKNRFDLIRDTGKHDAPYAFNLTKLNARKHLKFMGWKFWIRGQRSKVLCITSPMGKRFRSLYSACDAYLREENLNFSESRGLEVDTLIIKRNKRSKRRKVISHFDSFSSFCKKSKRRKSCHGLSLEESQSSKRPQQNIVKTSSQIAAKTVLSLLIDNDMILPRQKVRYIHKTDGKVLSEGQITRDGIKCKCCKTVYTLSNFEVHAGSTYQQPSASIFLQDGRSLLECEMQMILCKKPKDFLRNRLKGDCSRYKSDTICSLCHYGGTLLLCDHCPSSFHLSCVGLEIVPEGKWFCPSCRCGECGMSEFNSDTQHFTEQSIVYCDQCEHEHHVGCMRKRENTSLNSRPVGNWFCSNKCSKIFHHLRQLLGKSNPTSVDGLSWTILRSDRENGVDNFQFDAETMTEHDIKLCVALDVLHECFVTIIEPRTKSDFVSDLIFNKESELRRLNFYGFYTMLLEKGDELISVATFRVFGNKVAEMPLVGTRVKYRRQGMCRLLVNELEKILSELGVESLMLPAVPQLLKTWTSSFGFSKMSGQERLNFSKYTTLSFQDTTMCRKILSKSPTIQSKKKGNCDEHCWAKLQEIPLTFGCRTENIHHFKTCTLSPIVTAGDCRELINISSTSIEKVDSESELYSHVSEVEAMVEPINALIPVDDNHFRHIGYQIEAEHSPVSNCINPTEQTEQELGLGIVHVAPVKCINSNVSADEPSSITLNSPTNLNFELLRKRYEHIIKDGSVMRHLIHNVHNGVDNTFKYFYKRRMSTNN